MLNSWAWTEQQLEKHQVAIYDTIDYALTVGAPKEKARKSSLLALAAFHKVCYDDGEKLLARLAAGRQVLFRDDNPHVVSEVLTAAELFAKPQPEPESE